MPIELYSDLLKIAEEITAPAKFTLKGKPVVIVSKGVNFSSVYYEGGTEDDAFSVKNQDLKPVAAKKRPGYLSVDDLTWDGTGHLAWSIGWIARKVRLNLESPLSQENAVQNLYFELTHEVLEPTPGLFNIALGDKYGTEAAVMFEPTNELPDEIAKLQEQRPGFINRTPFFWALIKLGFRLTKNEQNVEVIRHNVPGDQQHFFDLGFAGKPLTP